MLLLEPKLCQMEMYLFRKLRFYFASQAFIETFFPTRKVSRDLNCMEHSDTCDLQYPDPYSRPILLQHFPLYRLSDEVIFSDLN